MRLLFSLIVISALLLPALHAEEATPFDVNSFNSKAVLELDAEYTYLSELTEKPETLRTFLGVIPVVSEDELPRLDLVYHKMGVKGILGCLRDPSGAGADSSWRKLASVSPGSTLDCGDITLGEASAAACIAIASSNPVSEIKNIDHPNCYNPVVAGLIRSYKLRQAVSAEALDERISNTIWFSANNRLLLGESLLDLARLKNRYGKDAEMKIYLAESQLSFDDKRGIAILAQCLKENAPMKQIVLYASRGEMPTYEFLLKLRCLRTGGSDPTLQELQKNFARLGMAAMGANLFTAREYSGVPSVLYPYFKAKNAKERQAAVAEVYAIDDFVNNHVQRIRDMLELNQNFKDVGSMSAEERIILTDILTRRYMKENEARFKYTEMLKSVNDGIGSCVNGDSWKDNVKLQAIGGVLKVAATGPPAFKAAAFVGNVVLVSMMAIGTVSSSANLLTNYQKLSHGEALAEICNVAQGIEGIKNLKGLGKEARSVVQELKEVRRSGGSYFKFLPEDGGTGHSVLVKPEEPQVKPAAVSKPADTRAQPPTKTVETTRRVVDAASEKPKEAGTAWADEFVLKPDSKSPAAKQKTQQSLERDKVDLVTPVVEKAKAELDDLRQKASSAKPEEAANARNALKAKEDAYVAHLFDAAVSDSRVLLVDTPNGRRLLYVPEKAGDLSVPKEIQDKIQRFNDALGKAGIDARTKLLAHPDGLLVATPADYGKSLGKKVREFSACQKAKLDSDFPYFLSSRTDPPLRVLSFAPGICPNGARIFSALRDLLQPQGVQGGGIRSEAQLAKAREEILNEFKIGLNDHERMLFSDVERLVNPPKPFKESVEGLFKSNEVSMDRVRTLISSIEMRARRFANSPSEYVPDPDADFVLMAALSLDSGMPPSIDPLGAHFKLFKALVDPAKDRAQYFNTLAAEARLDRNGALEAEYKQTAENVLREYDEQVITELGRVATDIPAGQPVLPDSVFAVTVGRYGNPDPSAQSFYQQANRELPKLLDASFRGATSERAGLLDMEKVFPALIGRGGFQAAYEMYGQQKGSMKLSTVVMKIGRTKPEETDFFSSPIYKKGSDEGVFPKVYGFTRNADQSVILMERIRGSDVGKLSANPPAGFAGKLGKLDGKISLMTSRTTPDGSIEVLLSTDLTGDNIIHNERTGDMVAIDYDIKTTARVSLSDYLFFQMLTRRRDTKASQLPEYLAGIRAEYEAAGSSQAKAFDAALSDAYHNLNSNYADTATRLLEDVRVQSGTIYMKQAVYSDFTRARYADGDGDGTIWDDVIGAVAPLIR